MTRSIGTIHVVAGAVTASDGRVLIAERPPGKNLAGLWEFPGGKLESGETRVGGLARELLEEIGITIRDPRPLMRVRHMYDFGEVQIDFWVVSRYSGEPQGLDGQRLRWCALVELCNSELLIADQPLARALRLPERLTRPVSDDYFVGEFRGAPKDRLRGAFCTSFDEGAAAASAAEFLVMRRAVDQAELAALCESVSVPVYGVGLTLEQAWRLGATGVSELGIMAQEDSG